MPSSISLFTYGPAKALMGLDGFRYPLNQRAASKQRILNGQHCLQASSGTKH